MTDGQRAPQDLSFPNLNFKKKVILGENCRDRSTCCCIALSTPDPIRSPSRCVYFPFHHVLSLPSSLLSSPVLTSTDPIPPHLGPIILEHADLTEIRCPSTLRLKRLSKLLINSTSTRRDSTTTMTSVTSMDRQVGACGDFHHPCREVAFHHLHHRYHRPPGSGTESLTSSLCFYPSSSSLSIMPSLATYSHQRPVSSENCLRFSWLPMVIS